MNNLCKASFGSNLHDPQHHLMVVDIQDIVGYIREGDHGIREQTKILRTVRKYDKERYRHMKTQLPYFGMSEFSPSIRQTAHFVQANGLILDLDCKQKIPDEMTCSIHSDPRVCLSYTSPSGVGMKIVFVLDAPIKSSMGYTKYYKEFAYTFGNEYHLMDILDFRNSDVSRISFLSYDPKAYFNPDPILLDTSMTDLVAVDPPMMTDGLTPDIYQNILKKLDTRPVRIDPEPPLLPAIEDIMLDISTLLNEYNITIVGHQTLPYGIKIKIKLGKDKGEVNIYHGKKGYSVVSSPRKGITPKLNDVAVHIISSLLLPNI